MREFRTSGSVGAAGEQSPVATRPSKIPVVQYRPVSLRTMFEWLRILVGALRSAFRPHRELVLENLAARQQLAVFKHRYPRPRLKDSDRLFWVLLSRVWRNWRGVLHVVRPVTVVRW